MVATIYLGGPAVNLLVRGTTSPVGKAGLVLRVVRLATRPEGCISEPRTCNFLSVQLGWAALKTAASGTAHYPRAEGGQCLG